MSDALVRSIADVNEKVISRWLAPLLSHTLPFPALFLAWDVLFSRSPREKGSNPKLEYIVDFCASMILQGKRHLRR